MPPDLVQDDGHDRKLQERAQVDLHHAHAHLGLPAAHSPLACCAAALAPHSGVECLEACTPILCLDAHSLCCCRAAVFQEVQSQLCGHAHIDALPVQLHQPAKPLLRRGACCWAAGAGVCGCICGNACAWPAGMGAAG